MRLRWQRQGEKRLDSRVWSSRLWTTVYCVVLCMTVAPSACDYPPESHTIGINYGLLGDNLPTPAGAVNLMKSMSLGGVRIFDASTTVLTALGNSGLEVVIGMGNDAIPALANDSAAADQWILQNVVAYPTTNITVILVGNELLSDNSRTAIWVQLVPAIQNLHQSLLNHNLSSIKLSTAAELNVLSWSSPPSLGVFREDIATSVLKPLLQFLNDTGSYFFVNVYPYFAWESSPKYLPLDAALFQRNTTWLSDGQYNYSNLFDAQLDAVSAAMEQLGFKDVRVAVSETGWPSKGSPDQLGANIENAATYNRNLVSYILSNPIVGTPRKPGILVPTYIFSLFNEDLKPGELAEHNWGILYANGSKVYPIDLTGKTPVSQYPPLNSSSSPAPLPTPPGLYAPSPSPTSSNSLVPAPVPAPLSTATSSRLPPATTVPGPSTAESPAPSGALCLQGRMNSFTFTALSISLLTLVYYVL